jgi:peroxiredoxin Q/BCP
MATMPQQGHQLPDVEFVTEVGERLSAGDLGGEKTVLYFYPKDDTPGCTKEACAFRDRMADYEEAGIRVYGVSLDSPESHRRSRRSTRRSPPRLTQTRYSRTPPRSRDPRFGLPGRG